MSDDLVMPKSIPLAESDGVGWPSSLTRLSQADRSWLLGVFIADGWADRDGKRVRSAISGLDGKPKEEQKRRVETLLTGLGVRTNWYRKYISVNDQQISELFESCGHLAWNKRVPSLRMESAEQIHALLDGLAADASRETRNGRNDPVYGTTSPTLALQIRVLYRMLGIGVSIGHVDDHGGFGTHPIYRVSPRLNMRIAREGWENERRDRAFARVRSISDGGVEACGDITTDTGKFWLPESDVLVHNCDRLTIWRCAEAQEDAVETGDARRWADPVIKWQHLSREQAVAAGYPPAFVPPDGLWMVHCLVRFPDGSIEDTSKMLGMGGSYTGAV